MTKELESELLATYESLGFNTVKIPLGTPSQRAEFVVTSVGNFQN